MFTYCVYKIIGYNLIGGNKCFRQFLSLFVLLVIIMTGTEMCLYKTHTVLFSVTCYIRFLKILFNFRQRERKGEKEGEKHWCVVTSRMPPSRDLANNPCKCPGWELNQRPFGSKAGTQSAEPHQPGLYFICH